MTLPRPATEDVSTLIAVYVFHGRPEAGAGREHALQHLVEVTIFEQGGELEASRLPGSIRELVGLAGDPPGEPIREAVDGCKQRGCLEERSNRYILAEHRKEAITRARDTYAADERHFDQRLVEAVSEAVGEPVSMLAEPMLVSGVKDVIAGVLRETVIEVEGLLDRGCKLTDVLAPDSEHDPVRALRQLADTLVSPGAGDSDHIANGVRRFLGSLDEQCHRYLATLHHKAFVRQILNFDPHLHAVQKESLGQTRLYLDTNVVIDYILEEHEQHGPTSDVLEASLRLGMQLFVSPATLTELERQLEAADLNRKIVDDPTLEAIIAPADGGLGSCPFLGAYLRKHRQHPGLTWEGFSAPYRDMEAYLLAKHVVVEAEEFGGVKAEKS
jgi:hypothetical protein